MLSESYALVTGASSGIGIYYAIELAKRGYNLILVSNEEAIHEVGKSISTNYNSLIKVSTLVIDLGQHDSAKHLYEWCKQNSFNVEVLVNNAGVYKNSDFIETSEAFNILQTHLHITTPVMLCYYFGKEMCERRRGFILNCSSITAHMPVQRLALYGSSKRFLKNFSRSLHIELIGKGVGVTTVCPGAVATDLYQLSSKSKKTGTKIGYIITPEKLAKRALKKMFRKKVLYIPWWGNRIFIAIIAALPTWLLKYIRKRGIY